jgi:hypothetical protein
MLPSGSATLVWPYRAVHPELAFTHVQASLYDSSPKNQAQPVGSPVDASVKSTVRGTAPEVGVPENAAVGGEGVTVMNPVREQVSVPPALPAVRLTV